MKEMNVRYQNQGDYQLPCIETKEHNELHIGVWANRHRQYLKQHHRIKHRKICILILPTLSNRRKQYFHNLSNHLPKKKMLPKN